MYHDYNLTKLEIPSNLAWGLVGENGMYSPRAPKMTLEVIDDIWFSIFHSGSVNKINLTGLGNGPLVPKKV